MKTNQQGIDLIKSFEGCKLEAYQDQVGVWTIGYGHTGSEVVEGLVWTQDQADAALVQDLERFEDGVFGLVTVNLNNNQFSALVCFAYNLGLGALKHATLLKLVNSQDYTSASAEFLRWDRAGGVEVAGLLRRRQAERDLFLT